KTVLVTVDMLIASPADRRPRLPARLASPLARPTPPRACPPPVPPLPCASHLRADAQPAHRRRPYRPPARPFGAPTRPLPSPPPAPLPAPSARPPRPVWRPPAQ